MIVRRSINKDELKELPKTVFPGRIHVIQSEAETEKAVAYLQSQPILGIDSETRPSFTKGQSHKAAGSFNICAASEIVDIGVLNSCVMLLTKSFFISVNFFWRNTI